MQNSEADVTICANSDWKGTYTRDKAPTGQIYLFAPQNITFDNCGFDNVVLTAWKDIASENTVRTMTVKNCKFSNVYNNYAIKDIQSDNVSITGNTFKNCGGGIMLSKNTLPGAPNFHFASVDISENTFNKVDVSDSAPEGKAGTRGLIQVASSCKFNDDSKISVTKNTATDSGPVFRILADGIKSISYTDNTLGNKLSTGGTNELDTEKIEALTGASTTYVAKIGETGYATLQAALSKAENGNIITLVKDIDITNGDEKYGTYIAKAIKVTLDLNGKKIHAANTVAGRMNFWQADLTLKDSSVDKTGEIYTTNIDTKNNCPVINLMSGAKLTMEGGTIDTAQENPETNGNSAVGLYGDTVFTMNDGTINSGWFGVASNGQDKDGYRNVIININGGKIVSKGDYAIYAPARGNSVLTISDGYVCGYAGGVAIKTGTLNVTGGEIVSMGKSSTGDWKDGTGGLDNAAINIDASYGPIVANISGGKMLAGGNAIGVISTENDTILNVTGGRFSDDSIGKYLEKGMTTEKANDGLYNVVARNEGFGDVAILTGMTADDGNPLLTLFTGINYLDYKNVGFTVEIGKDTIDTPLTTTVYTSVKADRETYGKDRFGSEYIFGANLVFDKVKYADVKEFTITPFATAPNGEKILGTETTVEFGTSYSGNSDPLPGDTP